MSPGGLRELVGRLAVSANALSALGAALDARARGADVPPEIRAHLGDVLAALGVRDDVDGVSAAAARPLLGEIRTTLLHGLARLGRGEQGPGWRCADPETLRAAGEVSAGFPTLLQRFLPELDGLAARLRSPGARFLDVGVGVASLAIEMARVWPALRVVGIDVWAPSLALARDGLRAAGVEARVELREQGVQDLPDVDAFDLAWIPSAFIPGALIPEAARRVHRSLRAHGWLLLASVNPGSDPLAASLARLRTVEWGGQPFTLDQASRLLVEAGFADVRALPTPPTSGVAFVAGAKR